MYLFSQGLHGSDVDWGGSGNRTLMSVEPTRLGPVGGRFIVTPWCEAQVYLSLKGRITTTLRTGYFKTIHSFTNKFGGSKPP